MFGFGDGGHGSLLAGTVKTVVFIAGLSYVAATWLSGSADKQAPSRLAAIEGRSPADPLTTGAIGTRANGTRLDPCVTPRR